MRCCLSAGAMEAEYLEIAKRYTKEELQTFAELLAVFVEAAERNPFGDVFGKTYEEIVGRSKSSAMGQFFTPEAICDLTAQIIIPENAGYYKTVNDPACGSGRLLLSAAKRMNPFQARTWKYYGTDKDQMCVNMTIINMVLYQLPCQVIWGNSLSLETYRVFYTEMLPQGTYVIREVLKQEQKQEQLEQKQEQVEQKPMKPEQMKLF